MHGRYRFRWAYFFVADWVRALRPTEDCARPLVQRPGMFAEHLGQALFLRMFFCTSCQERWIRSVWQEGHEVWAPSL